MTSKKNLSIKDIAVRSGVSIGTVDRVLHNRGRVSKKTQSRIRKIISDGGYRPNIFASRLSLGRTIRFGVVMPRPDQDSGYWLLPVRGMERARRELEAYDVGIEYYHFDRYSERSFEQMLVRAAREEPTGLLIAPVLERAARRIIPQFSSDIPCIFFDTNVPGLRQLSHIVQDGYRSGLLAANLIRKLIRLPGSIAMLEILPGDYHISKRIDGFRDALAGDNRIHVVRYSAESHKGASEFHRVSRRILEENKNLRGLYVTNAWTHPFAREIKVRQKRKDILIVGYDLVLKNMAYLENGGIDFLISQRPEMQGYEGINRLYRHTVLRSRVPKEMVVPLDILLKENAGCYQG